MKLFKHSLAIWALFAIAFSFTACSTPPEDDDLIKPVPLVDRLAHQWTLVQARETGTTTVLSPNPEGSTMTLIKSSPTMEYRMSGIATGAVKPNFNQASAATEEGGWSHTTTSMTFTPAEGASTASFALTDSDKTLTLTFTVTKTGKAYTFKYTRP